MSTNRAAFEAASAPVLRLLTAAPRWLYAAVLGIALAAGLLLPLPWGPLLLAAVALQLSWLVALSWPVLPQSARVARVVVIGAVVIAAAARAFGVG